MGTCLEDFSVFHDEDTICVHDGWQSVSDDDDCRFVDSVDLCNVLDRLLNHAFTIWIQSWSGLIENDYLRLSHQGTSDRDSLFLPPAEIIAFFSDFRLKFIWKSLLVVQKLHASSSFSCFFHVLKRVSFKSIRDVSLDCTREDSGVLVDQSDLFPQMGGVDVWLLVGAVVNLAWLDVIKLLNQFDYRWFARTALTDKSYILPLVNFEGNVIEGDCRWCRILEGYIPEFDVSWNIVFFSFGFVY